MFSFLGGGSSDASVAPALEAMKNTSKIAVKEKVSLIEAATAMLGQEVEMANKYKIFDERNDEIFYAVEQTDCCMRNLKQCLGDCASWKVDILYTKDGNKQHAYRLERPFTCTCGPCNRPTVTVTDNNTGDPIGKIMDPCTCCGLDFRIKDKDDNQVMNVHGSCCQMGLYCPLPCGPCRDVTFDIHDSAGGTVGSMKKKVPGCCKFFFAPDVQNYEVEFSGVSDPNYKILLMATAIFTDFKYFNDNSNENQQDAAQE